MNNRQKLVQQQFLNNEEAILKRLQQVYGQSQKDINSKIANLQFSIGKVQAEYDWLDDNDPEKAKVKSMIQSKIYQKQYQEALKGQVDTILDDLQTKAYTNISDYLKECYDDGFIGTMYDLQGQGIPLCMPLDQEAMVRAVQLDSKISKGLYSRMGEDVAMLKKHIAAEVTRGIALGMTFEKVAQQIKFKMTGTYDSPGGALARAMTIARTEGHRIQVQATMDACYRAKEKGADVVKQWDSTMDSATRESHVAVDGEIRELDEPFSNGLMFPGDPSGGAAEVVNCRCALLQRARWAVGGSFTKMNNITKQIEYFDSPESYDEFKKAFFSKENTEYMKYVQSMEEKHKIKDFVQLLEKMSDKEYSNYSKLLFNNPIYRKKKLDEGVFSTFNTTKADSIRPKSIINEMNKSKTGKNLLEYIEKEQVPVRLCYGIDNPDGASGQYDPFDDVILIYCDTTKTTKETALAVIHESMHRKLGGKGTFAEEVECYKAEVMHQKGQLTKSDIDGIILHVKKHYPELL